MAVPGAIFWRILVCKTVLLPHESNVLLVRISTPVSNLQMDSLARGEALTMEENHDDARAVRVFF